jgi:hypothetical protein
LERRRKIQQQYRQREHNRNVKALEAVRRKVKTTQKKGHNQ